jgi:hypothetical protein
MSVSYILWTVIAVVLSIRLGRALTPPRVLEDRRGRRDPTDTGELPRER